MSLADAGYVKAQYGTSGNLDARSLLHARFSTNGYGWFRWVFDQLDLRPGDCILELGCGTGELWAQNADRLPPGARLMLTDLSQGMLDRAAVVLGEAGVTATLLRVDAQALPYVGNRFDVIIANHMLYHVPDRKAALSEVARVLAPAGRFYATTIGTGHMAELRDFAGALGRGLRRLGGRAPTGFTLEDGPRQVAELLDGVELRRYPDGLRVTETEALLAYYRSMGSSELTPHLEQLRTHLDGVLARDGVIVITKDSGIVMAHKEGSRTAHE